MENYSKGKNVEEPMEKDNVPIPNLPQDFVWMQVKGGSKLRNLLEFAMKAVDEKQDLVWSGCGPAVMKAITCTEIVKRKHPHLHQFNKICYLSQHEHWDPKLEGLDPLVVIRDVPAIHILLSQNPINEGLPGYQGPSKDQRDGGRKPRRDHRARPNSDQSANPSFKPGYRKWPKKGKQTQNSVQKEPQ